MSSLLHEFGVKYPNTEKDMQLWQARFVLAIAEILDSKEEALREQFSFLNEKRRSWFNCFPRFFPGFVAIAWTGESCGRWV